MRLLRPIGALVVVVGLAACGGGGGGGPAAPNTPNPPGNPANPSGPAPGANASVSMVSNDDGYGTESGRFNPTTVSILRGGTVTWTNGTSVSHNVTFSGSGAPANIGNHTSGSNARTFATAGTFNYQCTNHSGMTGSVSVQ